MSKVNCPKSPTKDHEPDWQSVHIDVDVETYIDINCKYCGKSGCVGSSRTLEKELSWD